MINIRIRHLTLKIDRRMIDKNVSRANETMDRGETKQTCFSKVKEGKMELKFCILDWGAQLLCLYISIWKNWKSFLDKNEERGASSVYFILFMQEDEVVRLLAEVFLLPNYTIPLMGCFRPIARKIVDKAVWLLRFVPNLRSNSNAVATFDKDRILEETSVIEFYTRIGKGLDLHELACLAFCRALDLDPSLLG